MSTCLRCGEEKKVKVSVTATDKVAKWLYECKACGLSWNVEESRAKS